MKVERYSVVFAGEAHAALLRAALPGPCVSVTSRTAFLTEIARPGAVAFVDCDLFHHIEGATANVPVIGIVDDTIANTLPRTVRSLGSYAWLSHVVVATMLSTSLARPHLTALLDRLPDGPERLLGAAGIGRVALLASSNRREARFERIREFFSSQGLSARSVATITDVSEELVTNALYDAPVEAGYFKQPVPRTEQVDLPIDRACEISYGIDAGTAFVRLRDTFGALTRDRLLGVLTRCNTRTVKLDESRGGAGLGIWRVFSSASTLAITVVPGRLTDIRVGFATKEGRLGKQLLACDLFLAAEPIGSLASLGFGDDCDLFDQSVTLERGLAVG